MTDVDGPRLGEGPAEFRCEIVHETDRVAVCVGGDVDMATAPQVADALTQAATTTPPTDVVVDLAACTFLDSSGLSALLEGARAARAAGRGYAIRGANEQIVRLVELTSLTDELPFE